jgi:L-ascorbate metabolism protein UlaG (beta-lactamase superfamily)
MAQIRRLTDSCLVITGEDGATTLVDPGFHAFETGAAEDLGDVHRVLVTHEHRDHVSPAFVRWLVDRGSDVEVLANDAVAALLARHDIAARTDVPAGLSAEDVLHEPVPTGATPPNRAWTVDGLLTHPGDSQQPTSTAPVLALPLMAPWTSVTAAVAFARRLRPAQVVPVHDVYLDATGRRWLTGMVRDVLAADGIEVLPLDWGDAATI